MGTPRRFNRHTKSQGQGQAARQHEQLTADGWRDAKGGQPEKEPGAEGGSALGNAGPAGACGAGLVGGTGSGGVDSSA